MKNRAKMLTNPPQHIMYKSGMLRAKRNIVYNEMVTLFVAVFAKAYKGMAKEMLNTKPSKKIVVTIGSPVTNVTAPLSR